MNEESLAILSERFRLLRTQKGKLWHYRLVRKDADGHVALLLGKRPDGMDRGMREIRQTAKDKRISEGRVQIHDNVLWFGHEDGTLPPKSTKKALKKELSKIKALKRFQKLIKNAEVVEAATSPLFGAVPTEGPTVDGVDEAFDLGGHGTVSKRDIKKQTSYAMLIEAWDRWQNKLRRGVSIEFAAVQAAGLELNHVRDLAQTWMDRHPKARLELPKTKARRREVEALLRKLEQAADLLDRGFGRLARFVHTWETTMQPLQPTQHNQATQVAGGMDRAADVLAGRLGEQAPRVVAAHAKAAEIRETVAAQREQIQTAFDLAWIPLQRRFPTPDDIVPVDDLDLNDAVARLEPAASAAVDSGVAPDSGQAALAWCTAARRIARFTVGLDKHVAAFEAAWSAFDEAHPGDFDPSADGAIELLEALERTVRILDGLPDVFPRHADLDAAAKAAKAARAAVATSTYVGLIQAMKDVRPLVFGDLELSDLGRCRIRLEALEREITRAGSPDDALVTTADDLAKRLRRKMLALTSEDTTTDDEREQIRELDERVFDDLWYQHLNETYDWERDTELAWSQGHYERGRTLGQGGQGTVVLMESIDPSEAPVVVKEFFDPTHLQTELEVYGVLGPHPNIGRCLGKKKLGDDEVLVLEAIEGGTVGSFMQRMLDGKDDGSVSTDQFWAALQFMLRGTIRGLQHLHSKGLGHSDIKGGNVMIDKWTGEPVLIDMGGVQPVGSDDPEFTRGYAPSEDEEVGEKRDGFAIGGLAFRYGEDDVFNYGVLEGGVHRPEVQQYFDMDLKAFTKVSGTDGSKRGRKGVDTAYTDFIEKMMNADPEQRLSYDEALKHPFLRDPLLPESEVKDLVRKMVG